ncbi:glycosyltransferase [Microbacterium hominis]|uniref:D-inositol 3-phosphate glycosyltransferase n=1 Tax=Microbacterium hominis TaxID=162426 RepID=A0A7D4TP31_9MICO|nr:glycosyltransferase [Microbacterium hominis]QKJ20022.1 glycosyltransferase [Microbacterium hominis]
MTRLLLFTNSYPFPGGDTSFVRNEIEDLSAAFDEVIVFTDARDGSAAPVPMPGNVVLGGRLRTGGGLWRFTAPLKPRVLRLLAAAVRAESRAGRLRGHLRLFLMGARAGILQAEHPAVREAIAQAPRTVAYAFWGMGGGLGLPWLTGVTARAVRLHRYDLIEAEQPSGYLPFRPFLFSRADRVLAIADRTAQHLHDAYRDPRLDAKTVVSRLGVPGPVSIARAPRGAERVIVSCSAVTAVKRVDLVLDAVRELAESPDGSPVRWVHFGGGPGLDALCTAAATAPAGLRIELRGHTAHDEVTGFYASHRVDVFVNASSSEGVPVSIMEAIAHGVPVVATAVGGTPEIVGEDLGSGVLVAPDATPGQIAAAVRRVLDDPDDAFDPRRVWAQRYDVRITGRRAAELVRGLLPS